MAKQTFQIDGLKELESGLAELKNATAKNVIRRGLAGAAQPMADKAESRAPQRLGTLRRSIDVGKKLSKRQAQAHRKMFRDDRASVEIFVGAGPVPQAHLKEFGGDGTPAIGFMRSAWDEEKVGTLMRVRRYLAAEIEKAAARARKKAARLLAKKGG